LCTVFSGRPVEAWQESGKFQENLTGEETHHDEMHQEDGDTGDRNAQDRRQACREDQGDRPCSARDQDRRSEEAERPYDFPRRYLQKPGHEEPTTNGGERATARAPYATASNPHCAEIATTATLVISMMTA